MLQNWLNYYRKSLADGYRMDINEKELSDSVITDSIDNINLEELRTIFDKVSPKESGKDEEEIRSIPVIIAPLKFKSKFDQGIKKGNSESESIYPFWIPAIIDEKGILLPPDSKGTKPWFSRSVLEPGIGQNSNIPIVSTVELVDTNLAKYDFNSESWDDYYNTSLSFFKDCTSESTENIQIEDFLTINSFIIAYYKESFIATNIFRLYDYLLKNKPVCPLLENIAGIYEKKTLPLPDINELFLENTHLGHFNNNFPLSRSQRQTMLLFENHNEADILAVNGPPGTGKTTLIQSILANCVVKNAIGKKLPPKIVVSSTVNQAIQNVLKDFKIFSESDTTISSWIPENKSLGTYLVSTEKKQQEWAKGKGHQVLTFEKDDNFSGDFKALTNRYKIEELESFYIDAFAKKNSNAKLNNITDVIEHLHSELLQTTDSINNNILICKEYFNAFNDIVPINMLEEYKSKIDENNKIKINAEIRKNELYEFNNNFNQFRNSTIFLRIFGFISSVKRKYLVKLKLLFSNSLFENNINLRNTFEAESLLLNEIRKTENAIQLTSSFNKSHEPVYQKNLILKKQWISLYNEIVTGWENFVNTKDSKTKSKLLNDFHSVPEYEQLNMALDVTLRYKAFELAIHYYQGCFIAYKKSTKTKITKIKQGRSELFTQLSFLTPLFVSTFHMLPKFFSAKDPNNDWNYEPLLNFTDLLIVDEAGMVAPELSFPSFALAKKALIVGDIFQIEPIWNIYLDKIDKANFQSVGLQSNHSYEDCKSKNVLAFNGTLMHMAQIASKYSTTELVRGTLLIEHRRCVDEIIHFSNKHVYNNQLLPKVGSLIELQHEKRNNNEPVLELPPIGYINVNGKSEPKRPSRINIKEAKAIAHWVSLMAGELRNCYKKPLEDIVGIVTPFAPQKIAILKALNDHGLGKENIIVGTVHALQGAEYKLIIFSPVYGTNELNITYFFDLGFNMLNVALSRAQEHFLVIGNMALFNPALNNKPSGALAHYLFNNSDNELNSAFLYNNTYIKEQQRISTLKKHCEELKQLIENAKRQVIIVSPFISISAIQADDLEPLIKRKTQEGIRIIVYTDKYLDTVNGQLKDQSLKGRNALKNAGAELIVLNGIHNKAIAKDEDVLIEGSFNWLSAVRDEKSKYFRHETSHIIKDKDALDQIKQLEDELKQIENINLNRKD